MCTSDMSRENFGGHFVGQKAIRVVLFTCTKRWIYRPGRIMSQLEKTGLFPPTRLHFFHGICKCWLYLGILGNGGCGGIPPYWRACLLRAGTQKQQVRTLAACRPAIFRATLRHKRRANTKTRNAGRVTKATYLAAAQARWKGKRIDLHWLSLDEEKKDRTEGLIEELIFHFHGESTHKKKCDNHFARTQMFYRATSGFHPFWDTAFTTAGIQIHIALRQTAILFRQHFSSFGTPLGWSCFQLTLGKRVGMLWTGCHLI